MTRLVMRLIAAIAVLALCAAPAAAEEKKRGRRHKERPIPMAFRTGAEVLTGSVGTYSLTKMDATAGVTLDAIPKLTLNADLLIGSMHINFDAPLDDGLEGAGEIWAFANLSARVGAAIKLYDRDPWLLQLFADYESSLIGANPVVTALRIDVPEGSFDVSPYAKENAHPELFWNRFSVGFRFTARFGRWTPGLSMGYQLFAAKLDLVLTEDGRDTIDRLGFDDGRVERRHNLSFWSVPIEPELEFKLTKRSGVGIQGMVMPAADSVFLGGSAYYRLNL